MDRWFLDNYQHKHEYQSNLDSANISETEYLAAVEELLSLFPRAEAEAHVRLVMRERGAIGASSLHPAPYHRLDYHPVPAMLSIGSMYAFCELLKLGRDLRDTRDLPRVGRLRKDLKKYDGDLTDFSGKLFELELLAEFQRAGLTPELLKPPGPDIRIRTANSEMYVEARHRGSPSGMIVFSLVGTGLASIACGSVRVRLLDDALGGQPEDVLARNILLTIEQIARSNPTKSTLVSERSFIIEYDPNRGRSLVVSFGRDTYAEDIEPMVRNSLEEKEKQLLKVASQGAHCLIAMDFRSLIPSFPNEPHPDYHESVASQVRAWRESVVRAALTFLSGSTSVSGVLCWWQRDWPSLTPEIRVFRPDLISLITTSGELTIASPQDLYDACAGR